MHDTFQVLTPLAFLNDVVQEASNAKKRVWMQAMEVEPGVYTDQLLEALQAAASRGVDARYHADWYSLLVTDGTFNYWPLVARQFRKERKRRQRKKRTLAKDLAAARIHVLFTNPPTLLDRLFPVRGRNHMKIVVIDETAWIGGVNFHDENFNAYDCMIKITDPKITQEIAYVYGLVDTSQTIRDMSIDCSDSTILLVDGGVINRSIILRNACELVTAAKESVELITPLIPDGAFLQALKDAIKRGVQVEVISPQTKEMSGVYELLDIFNDLTMHFYARQLPITFKPFMIHAKVLIVDGKEAIVGSHNFSSRGVRMGTEEIALQTKNHSAVTELRQLYTTLKQK